MKHCLAAGLLLALVGCGGDSGTTPVAPPTYAIGGTIAGLTAGGLVLANGTETVSVDAGATHFTLPPHASGTAYAVVVQAQPAGERCTVSAGSGTVASQAVSTIAVDCSSHQLFVAGNGSNVVDVLPLDSAGMPRAADLAQVASDQDARRLAMSPDRRHLYAVASGADVIDLYDIADDGTLTRHAAPASVTTGDNPGGIGITPDGRYLYASSAHTGSIDMYALGDDGVPSLQSPPSLPLPYAASVTISPDGGHLYASSQLGSGAVAMFAIGSDGQLTALATPTAPAGGLAYDVVLTPDGKYAYANTTGGTIREFAVQADGTLATLGDLGANLSVPQDITISPDGKFAYVPDWDGNVVVQYAVGADGQLTPLATPTVAAGDGPVSVAISSDGKKAYVASLRENTVAVFDVNADGTLDAASRTTLNVAQPYHLLYR